MRERERKRGDQASLFDPWSFAPKRSDFNEDPNEEIFGNQGFRARDASNLCYYASRGRDSSDFGLFSTIRAVWLCFLP